VSVDPSQFRLLLAGARVSHLVHHFAKRGYPVDACSTGQDALRLLEQIPRHLLVVELELDDMMSVDLMQKARRLNLVGAVVLVDDPIKSGLIVSALVRGVDAYVATPIEDPVLFRVVERALLAQWALARTNRVADQSQTVPLERQLKQQLKQEQRRRRALAKELGALRTENVEMKERLERSPTNWQQPPTKPGVGVPSSASPDPDEAHLYLSIKEEEADTGETPRSEVAGQVRTDPDGARFNPED
jgi:CheY-like chemotaxis protein